jgi:hypothetical protein
LRRMVSWIVKLARSCVGLASRVSFLCTFVCCVRGRGISCGLVSSKSSHPL